MYRILLALLTAACFPVGSAAADLPMRLGDAAQPLAYRLALRVDPDQPEFSGEVRIELRLNRPARRLRLHALALRIDAASLRPASGSALSLAPHRARVQPADAGSIWLDFGSTQPAGLASLTIKFHGRVTDSDATGLFRQKDAGDWYAITQFEDSDARRAFPGFDEPGWKVPFTLTLTVPQGQQAFANTPLLREQPAEPGWKRLEFKPTPPLPSYLLAFAVGPFDVLDGGRVGSVPLRYVTPRGRAQEAGFAARVTPAIMQSLQAYFGSAYPFEKQDSLSIPVIDSFGAMENAGLITYAARYFMARPGEETAAFQREYVSTAAHEMAHQWFGNKVTMAWWDDLWLNESFASWLGDKITGEVRPDWRWDAQTPQARAAAMRADRLPGARRVHQPILTPADMGTAFDEITYSKGQSVLSMFEAWLGPQRMQAGVRRYMAAHAWGNATGADFMAALADGDAALASAFSGFIDQAGIPKLRVDLLCEGGPPRLRLRQSRYQALGAPPLAGHWSIPVVLRTPAGITRYLLGEDEASVALPDAGCPAWLQPNEGGAGYYRSAVDPALLRAYLREGKPGVNDTLALLDDQLALAESGDLPMADLLPLIAPLAQDGRREVSEALAEALLSLGNLLAPADRPAYARLWQASLGDQARGLGLLPRAADTDDQRQLRELLLPLLAAQGDDAPLRAQARELAHVWLDAASVDAAAHPELLEPGLRQAVLRSAAIDGDETLFDGLAGVLRRAADARLRADLIEALAAFGRPALADRALALALEPGSDFRERLRLLKYQAADPARSQAALQFLSDNEALLRPRLSPEARARQPIYFTAACSAEAVERLQQVFGPHAGESVGGPGYLAKAVEAARLCTAYREAQGTALQAWLRDSFGAPAR